MKYQEILDALSRGEAIHWKNRGYQVKFNKNDNQNIPQNNLLDDLIIVWGSPASSNYNCVGLNLSIFSSDYDQNDFYVDISPDFADIGRMIPHLYKILRDYKEKTGLTYFQDYFVRVEMGRKYFKLFACEVSSDGKTNTGRLVCFVDKTTGDIYKPASFAAPAKHARGNVNSDSCGMEAFTEGGFVRYLN